MLKKKAKQKIHLISTKKRNILQNYAKYSHADVPNIYSQQIIFN